MFLGEFRHQVDEKVRFRIPAKLKQMLGPDPFITVGSSNCLFMVKNEDAKKLIETLSNRADITDVEKTRVVRLITSRGFFATEDKQGRIMLPPALVKHAKIVKNIVTNGCYDRVEIWAEEVWDEYSEIDGDEFDACLKLLKETPLQ